MELDLDFVRAQFPAFADPQTRDWAFFENAGGSYVPATVISRLQRFFVDTKCNPMAHLRFPSRRVRRWMSPTLLLLS